jgi:hypothetical protein
VIKKLDLILRMQTIVAWRSVAVVHADQKPLLVGSGHCWSVRLLHFAAARSPEIQFGR